ncbi:MAG: ABC transporter permease [Pseudorhodobacter sp.]|nr:ABC transporter permease [Rhizobacter sp.]
MPHRLKNTLAGFIKAYGTVAALLLICLVFAVLSPNAFATLGNAVNVSRQIAFLVLVAVGATLVMAAGEFDLSVGAAASLGGVMAAQLAVLGVPVPLAVLLTLAAGMVFGMANGWLVGRFKLLSFITTLATGTMLAGFTFWLTDGSTVFNQIPEVFTLWGRAVWLGLPGPSWVMACVVGMAWLLMQRTPFGRQLYAVGGNERAARLVGVNVMRHKVWAFGLCALVATGAGVLLASRLGSAHPTGGNGLFLPAYAAAFLGMTAHRSGVPHVLGSLLGAATLGILANGLTILNVPSFLQDMVTGAIVVAAVVFQKISAGPSR